MLARQILYAGACVFGGAVSSKAGGSVVFLKQDGVRRGFGSTWTTHCAQPWSQLRAGGSWNVPRGKGMWG